MDIYSYDDFRLYLKERYRQKMLDEPHYSYRKFAKEAGFANPGYLNDVVKGFKPLSENASEKVGKVFRLKPHEIGFLKLLAHFGQAKTPDKKEHYYQQITVRRNRSRFTRLNPAMNRYYQDYRYLLVRGAIEVLDFRGDYDALAAFLDPPLPVAMVKKLVRELCEWNLVEKVPDGRYRTTSSVVEPGSLMPGLGRRLNGEWLAQAKESLYRLPKEKRHVSTLVLNISEPLSREINEMMERFREEVFRKVEADRNPQRIMQLSLAYLPKSRIKP